MAEASQNQFLSAAYELLKQWSDIGEFDAFEEIGPEAVYKTNGVFWLLLYQRLNSNANLQNAVLHFIETAPDELKAKPRLREGSLSTNRSSFSDARHRISQQAAHCFDDRVSSSIMNSTQAFFDDQRVFLIDESTFALTPVAELQEHFPPASNQHGDSAWPITRSKTATTLWCD